MSTHALSAPISSLSLLLVQTQADRWKAASLDQLTDAHLYLDIALIRLPLSCIWECYESFQWSDIRREISFPKLKCSNLSTDREKNNIMLWEWLYRKNVWPFQITPQYSCNFTLYILNMNLPCNVWCRTSDKPLSGSMTMMTSSYGNIFHVTGPLCGEFTGLRWIPQTKASDAELWCFLWSAPN